MNLLEKHNINLPFSEFSLFESQVGFTSSFYIKEGVQLTKQLIQVPFILICISGSVVYQDTSGNNGKLTSGDFIKIKPTVEYSLKGLSDSQILLIK